MEQNPWPQAWRTQILPPCRDMPLCVPKRWTDLFPRSICQWPPPSCHNPEVHELHKGQNLHCIQNVGPWRSEVHPRNWGKARLETLDHLPIAVPICMYHSWLHWHVDLQTGMDSHGTQLPAIHIQSGRRLNHPGDEYSRKTGFIPHHYWITEVPHAWDLPRHCLCHWSTQPLPRQTHVQSLGGSEARAPVHSSHKGHRTPLRWHGAVHRHGLPWTLQCRMVTRPW